MATYLTIVNSVLTRLREPTVNTNTATAYSALVGTFVNDAKRVIEDAWQWLPLMEFVNIPTVASTESYSLNTVTGVLTGTSLNARARPRRDVGKGKFMVYNTTVGFEQMLDQYQYDTNVVQSSQSINNSFFSPPSNFAIQAIPSANYVDGQINRQVSLFPIPDAAYNIRMFFTNPQNNLVNDGDILLCPREPIEQLAYLYCLYERGEEMGESVALTQKKVNDSMGDAIAHDQDLQTQQSGFYVNEMNYGAGSTFFLPVS